MDQSGYQYAFVAGNSRDYLWLLARTPQVSDGLKADFVAQAKALGFATDELIWVDHAEK
jgi:apolipoprotein D and lipocalin family protein